MFATRKNLLYIVGAFLFVLVVGRNLVTQRASYEGAPVDAATPDVATPTLPTPSPAPPPPGALADEATVDFAVSLAELDGLRPDAAPGTTLDVWVAWGPPVTKRPRVQSLLRGVRLAHIVPPVTPDGPAVALLSVRDRQVARLIYGTRWGSLSVTTPSVGY